MPKTSGPFLSVIIPTLNAAAGLASCLDSIGKSEDVVVILVDGGSNDDTRTIAETWGAKVLMTEAGRGHQLRVGAQEAETEWLFFLHADTILEADWLEAVRTFTAFPSNQERAGYGHFVLSGAETWLKSVMERGVAWRSRTFGWPFGDQGLLIHQGLYNRIGGYRPFLLFEDVDLVRAIGRKNLSALPFRVVTSATRYEQDGYVRRIFKNLTLQCLYRLGVSPDRLAGIYK